MLRFFSVAFPKENDSLLWETKMTSSATQKTEVQQGTLALMVLKTLDVLGASAPLWDCSALRADQGDLLFVNQGTLYPVLLRLE